MIQKYTEWGEGDTNKQRTIAHLIKYLKSNLDTANTEKLKEFITITEKLDQLRDTDWKSTFTELQENLKPYI